MSDALGTRLRWELLHVAIATIEATWVYALVQALRRPGDPTIGYGWLLVFAVAMVSWNRYLLHSERWEGRIQFASLGAALGGTIVVVQIAYAPALGLLSPADIADLFLAPWHILTATFTPLSIAGAAFIILWFRTIHITQEPLTFHFTAYRFRLGVLFLLTGLLIAGALSSRVSPLSIFVYFGAGLFAIALARAEQVSNYSTSGTTLPFSPRWVGTLLGVLVLTLSAGWLLSLVMSPAGLSRIGHTLQPLLAILDRGLYYLIYAIFFVIVMPLVNTILWLLQRMDFDSESFDNLREFQPPTEFNEAPETMAPVFLDSPVFAGVRFIVPIVIVAGILLIIAWRLQRNRGRRERSTNATREPITRDGIRVNIGDLLARGRNRLGEMLRRLGPRGWFGTESIEDLYRNLLLWGARHGKPRHPDETPYEYIRALHEIDTEHDEELKRLTDAYVTRRYGSEEISSDELERLKDAWNQLNAGAGSPEE